MSRRNYAPPARGGSGPRPNMNPANMGPPPQMPMQQGSGRNLRAPPPRQVQQQGSFDRDSDDDMYMQHGANGVLGVPVWQDSAAYEHGSYLQENTPPSQRIQYPGPQGGGMMPPPGGMMQPQFAPAPVRMLNAAASQNQWNQQMQVMRDSNVGQAVPASTPEAFRIIASGVTAETEARYQSAVNDFLAGGEMLALVSEREADPHIRSLLNTKAIQVLEWSKKLHDWYQQGMRGSVPRRFVGKLGVNVVNRLGACAGRIDAGSTSELRTMYYTPAANKVVSEFTKDGYRLQCIEEGRTPQLMVVITMYNEDQVEMYSTLKKVANNIAHIKSQKLPGYEGDDAWKNILVVIVSDGRTKANKGTLAFLRDVGAFDEDVMNIMMVGVDVMCHVFEFCVQLKKAKTIEASASSSERYPPTQVVFALKEHNGGKLNSHEWYFNAFAEQIQPEYTVLLDVGTMPTAKAFYLLLCAMEIDPQIGGTCGEIAVDKPIPHLCNWVIAAQHFEYKISNVMDKSLESVFGFISVLPGAFSAYRYKAIRGAPLEAYFKSLTTPMNELGPFQGNMYLAEDRILCFELLARRNCRWTMQYVKDAIARTDVPTDLVALIGQRRRWLNGSFFALVYTILNWGRVYTESNHSYIRKLFLCIQYAYMTANVALSWVLPANFFLVTYFLVIVGFKSNNWGYIPTSGIPDKTKDIIVQVFSLLYGTSFLIQLVAGLGNKPKHIKGVYRLTAVFYALVMLLTSVIAFGFIMKPWIDSLRSGMPFATMVTSFEIKDIAAFVASVGVFFLASCLHCEMHHIAMSFIQYMCLLPTFVNILNTYSFCNLHDLSWGTKGLESSDGHGPKAGGGGNYKDAAEAKKAEEARKKKEGEIKDKMEGDFQYFRSKLLIFWLLSQMGFAYLIISFDSVNGQEGANYLKFLFYIVAGFNLFRLFGSTYFLLIEARICVEKMCIRGTMRDRLNAKKKKQAIRAAQTQHV
ncbi:hypothetical protein SDRG_09152 [Saprolegnia diclina VS20]|uniref:chitin synthase n=1 Tax=Saprolegnia diclina (strain VS20) TaxID=1156394 RepID=T0QEI9_SAPDV|nr:hypothetical protein SDRG_09152 [Saprolegnia diclina VS20]EQC33166.1 hypothetical protein SDRG_09152 [Saprolegnia diclina VS20]|eukprot:XP_008613289.1 hypothetical protein SDRG_09152 [Saprolegnia diclina VS20]